MNQVREAIDRVGGRFEPPGDVRHVIRQGHRVRTRRRIAVGAFALAVAAGGSLMIARAFPLSGSAPHPGGTVGATHPPAAVLPAAPVCPTPTGSSPPPVILSAASGPAGSTVGVSGTFPNAERWLQLWWNADPDTTPDTVAPPPWLPAGPDLRFGPAGPGPVEKVASVTGPAETGSCSFQTGFTVPDVEPGTYRVLWVFGAADPPATENGYSLLVGSATFEVTS